MPRLTESPPLSINSPTLAPDHPPGWAVAIRNIIWLSILSISLIGLLEGLFFLLHLGEEEVVRLRPVTGFGLVENRLVTWRSEGFSQDRTNSFGMREKEILPAKPANVKRIALLGDSVVEALQVPLEKTFGKLMETSFNTAGKATYKYEVLNFGNSAYSTVQEYYRYINEAAAFKPDIVILFYHNGDNEKNMIMEDAEKFLPRPYAKIDSSGNLVANWSVYEKYMAGTAYDRFQSQEFLRRNSRIFGVWSKADLTLGADQWYSKVKAALSKATNWLAKFTGRTNHPGSLSPQFATTAVPDLICSAEEMAKIDGILQPPTPSAAFLQDQARAEADSPITTDPLQSQEQLLQRFMSTQYRGVLRVDTQRIRVTAGLIYALNRECQKNGTRLVVVELPTQNNSLLFFRQFNAIEKLGQEIGFESFNLHEHFPPFSPTQSSDYFYYAGVHLNAKGHKLTACRLEQFLKQKHLLD